MNNEMHPEEIAFNQRINAVFLRKEDVPFEEVIRLYRQIESEFVERAGDDQSRIVETNRRVTEWLLSEAGRGRQPHDVCTAIWEELVERGFSDHLQRCTFTGIYVRCCQVNGEFKAGIAVLEPLIIACKEWLNSTTLTPEERAFWERDLAVDYKIHAELKAGLRK